ncbi:hypothetical protein EG68_09908 [Paragonimus skrjabini miyazakii]|uniref:Uncharacterized protein n=1 Tax=Paragonimus skrjabini miyazakii TaxID=59628 RepID=A0A8S9YKV1_9TREM|nr:hypothetical protein EG68_09908 [Paragonimus skrjabini miyazakii]
MPYSLEDSLLSNTDASCDHAMIRQGSVSQFIVHSNADIGCSNPQSVQLNRRPPRPSNVTQKPSNRSTSASQIKVDNERTAVHDSIWSGSTKLDSPSRSIALMRRPRTPTLGRAALFARASYANVNKFEQASGVTNQNIDARGVPDPQNEIWSNNSAANNSVGIISRSSSVNCELRDHATKLDGSPFCSTSTLTKIRDSLPTNQPNIFSIPTSSTCNASDSVLKTSTQRKAYHAYDTVPFDYLETANLLPNVQLLSQGVLHRMMSHGVQAGVPQSPKSPHSMSEQSTTERPNSVLIIPVYSVDEPRMLQPYVFEHEGPQRGHKMIMSDQNREQNTITSYVPLRNLNHPSKQVENQDTLKTFSSFKKQSRLPVACKRATIVVQKPSRNPRSSEVENDNFSQVTTSSQSQVHYSTGTTFLSDAATGKLRSIENARRKNDQQIGGKSSLRDSLKTSPFINMLNSSGEKTISCENSPNAYSCIPIGSTK